MLQTSFRPSCMNRASVFEWYKRFKEGRESVRYDERCRRSKEVNIPELIGQTVRVRVTMLRFKGSSGRDSVGRGQHSSNRINGISSRTIHQSTTPSLSLTIWPRWASGLSLTLPIVQTLLPMTFGNSLSSQAVIMRQLRRWKRLWQMSLTRSRKRTSIGPSRSCWKGTTSALQPEEINSKVTRVSCAYYQKKCPYEKSLETYLMILVCVYIYIYIYIPHFLILMLARLYACATLKESYAYTYEKLVGALRVTGVKKWNCWGESKPWM